MAYDINIPEPFAEAYLGGELILMETDAGLSTTLVDSTYTIVGSAGLVEIPDVDIATAAMATSPDVVDPSPSSPFDSSTALAMAGGNGAPGAVVVVAAIAGLIVLGTGTWYFVRKRRRSKPADSGPDE